MKRVTALLLVVMAFVFSSSFTVNSMSQHSNSENNYIEVVFSRQLDFNDLVKIKLDMANKGAVLNYKTLAFDENGKLKSIDFSIDFKDGFSGSAWEDQLTNQSRFGFFRNYDKDVASPFGTGKLP